jgi:5-formyltetrahydrofolate cyclo-ligase
VPDYSGKADTKLELRRRVLAARRSLSAPVQARAAESVRRTAADLVRRLAPAIVTAYVPVGTEPGGPGLPGELAGALPAGGRLLLPVLLPDLDLDWATWADGEPLVAAGRGLREPAGPRLGSGAAGRAEVMFVPALAVDRRGHRLGRGGGSYDRALARAGAATLAVALLHDGELLPEVPAEAHDRPVRAAITPADGLIRLDGEAYDDALLALG